MGGPEDPYAIQAGRQAQKELRRVGRCHRFGELLFLCFVVCGTGVDKGAHLNTITHTCHNHVGQTPEDITTHTTITTSPLLVTDPDTWNNIST